MCFIFLIMTFWTLETCFSSVTTTCLLGFGPPHTYTNHQLSGVRNKLKFLNESRFSRFVGLLSDNIATAKIDPEHGQSQLFCEKSSYPKPYLARVFFSWGGCHHHHHHHHHHQILYYIILCYIMKYVFVKRNCCVILYSIKSCSILWCQTI